MSNSFRVAIVGCGNIAGGYDERAAGTDVWTHAKGYSERHDMVLVGATDTDERRRKDFCTYWKVQAYSDLISMMALAKPDIVSICTPNETHKEILETILRYPVRAVICEKPLALSLEDARSMEELAAAKNVVLAVNYIRRWDTALDALGSRLQSREFGKIQNARVLYTKGVFHNGSHAINLLQGWLGPVLSANVRRARLFPQDVEADFSMAFRDCPDVVFQNCDANFFGLFSVELVTEKAYIRLPHGGRTIEWQGTTDSAMTATATLGAVQSLPCEIGRAIPRLMEDLVSVLGAGGRLKMAAAEAVATVEACELVRMEAAKRMSK